jgi:hypothetical protein
MWITPSYVDNFSRFLFTFVYSYIRLADYSA